ncbi:MAG: pectate lyase, partial [Cyclobacteriaceae bacterium]|nr:pectate lyase [Cyclobacteriaceae bacterium]
QAEGFRTVVFRVSGNIELESPISIKNPYISIAGQTAPGDGICLKNHPLSIDANQVIVRYIRVRLGDVSGKGYDAVGGRYIKNVILDHVSASWSVDECMSIYRCDSLTVQWCMISESMFLSKHEKGNHGFGGIWGGNYASYHHNLLAHHASRTPRFAAGTGHTDYRNNVIYNWGYNSAYGGSYRDPAPERAHFNTFKINMVGNYYKPGPATKPGEISERICEPYNYKNDITNYGKWFVADNVMVGSPSVTKDNWQGVHPQGGKDHIVYAKLDEPWSAMSINQQTAEEAYQAVLENAGAVLPNRDAVDTRIAKEVRGGFATYEGIGYHDRVKVADKSKKTGIIDSQNDVGGWPELKSTDAPKDTDHDGMPDAWEKKNGLNPNDADDGNKMAKDGYTMLEKYINSIK